MEASAKARFYEQTLVYGCYTKQLGELAKKEAKIIHDRRLKEQRRKRKKIFIDEFHERNGKFRLFGTDFSIPQRCIYVGIYLARILGQDWVFLALMGISISVLSFWIDYMSARCRTANIWLYEQFRGYPAFQYFIWITFPLVFILFSAGFVHQLAPQAIGSGIPEMKTILQGTQLPEFLTFKVLIAKVVGLTTAFGSGLPLGREGPLLHIASIIATLQVKMLQIFDTAFENEARLRDVLAAACAVGVACSYASPVGGVLLSIEVTAVYFAITNYWRGFFAAFCGTTFYRLLAIWFQEQETITTLFRTDFKVDYPYEPIELVAFAITGVFCGLGGAFFVVFHRQVVLFHRRHKRLNEFFVNNRFVYPFIVTLIISTITCPLGIGQFMAGEATLKEIIKELFTNKSWIDHGVQNEEVIDLNFFQQTEVSIFVTLLVFIVMRFWMTAVTGTLPIPAGIFLAIFVLGGAFGRLVGECMAMIFPQGITIFSESPVQIIPGEYAVIGAAAFASGVTQGLATIVIVCEMTGQIVLILPIIISVLLANAVSRSLQPSIYESMIKLKKLPYLPHFVGSSHTLYTTLVEDIMIEDVIYISFGGTYADIKNALDKAPKVRAFPVVESSENMFLLGSVDRTELLYMINHKLKRRFNRKSTKKMHQSPFHSTTPIKDPEPIETTQVSRFQVTKVADSVFTDNPANCSLKIPEKKRQEFEEDKPPLTPSDSLGANSTFRSILKRTSPFVKKHFNFEFGGDSSAENTLTSVDQLSLGSKPTDTITSEQKYGTVSSFLRKHMRLLQQAAVRTVEFVTEEDRQWELEQLNQKVDFTDCVVDASPLQLVEKTTLYKVHSMFLMLNLTYAYVTQTGRLIGVVGLKEVRRSLEGTLNSQMFKSSSKMPKFEVPIIEVTAPEDPTLNTIKIDDDDYEDSANEDSRLTDHRS